MRVARGMLIALALMLCAWFVVGIRQTHAINQASAIILGSATPSPAAAGHAGSLLRSAGWLNPDSEVDVLRGQLALLQNESARAEQIAAGVTRNEPLNVEAWALLAAAAQPVNHALFEHAIGQIARLDPVVR